MLSPMATTPINPFKKSTEKNSLLSVTLTPDQRHIVEQLATYLDIKTNAGVALEGLAVLYDKHRRQLDKTPTDQPTDQPADPAA